MVGWDGNLSGGMGGELIRGIDGYPYRVEGVPLSKWKEEGFIMGERRWIYQGKELICGMEGGPLYN